MSVAIFISEPVSTGSGALFQVTLKDALTAETIGRLQLLLRPEHGRQFLDADGIPYPDALTFDQILTAACGRLETQP